MVRVNSIWFRVLPHRVYQHSKTFNLIYFFTLSFTGFRLNFSTTALQHSVLKFDQKYNLKKTRWFPLRIKSKFFRIFLMEFKNQYARATLCGSRYSQFRKNPELKLKRSWRIFLQKAFDTHLLLHNLSIFRALCKLEIRDWVKLLKSEDV